MAIKGTEALTLVDLAKRLDPNKKVDRKIVEMRSLVNDWIKDAMWMQCNDGTSHRTTRRVSLPPVVWTAINRGAKPGKSVTKQVEEKTGVMSAVTEVDNKLLDISDDAQETMLSEERAQTESIDQELSQTFFYGDLGTKPAAFNGVFPRYSSLADLNVFGMGGTGTDNTSMALVTWGSESCHMIYPKGTAAGLQRTFKTDTEITDDEGGVYLGCRAFYNWHCGMALRDPRTCARIANIDTAMLGGLVENGAEQATARKLVRVMTLAHNSVYRYKGAGRMVWYANMTIFNMLHLMAADKMNVNLGLKEFEGETVTTFLGIPIRLCDTLINTEEAIA